MLFECFEISLGTIAFWWYVCFEGYITYPVGWIELVSKLQNSSFAKCHAWIITIHCSAILIEYSIFQAKIFFAGPLFFKHQFYSFWFISHKLRKLSVQLISSIRSSDNFLSVFFLLLISCWIILDLALRFHLKIYCTLNSVQMQFLPCEACSKNFRKEIGKLSRKTSHV